MPKWIREASTPTLLLWVYAVALGIAAGFSPSDGRLSYRADMVSRLAFSFVIASWVIHDAHKRGRKLCYDFDSFLFFLWPVVGTVHLFRTRGARAFLTPLCFIGICSVMVIVQMVTFLLRARLFYGSWMWPGGTE